MRMGLLVFCIPGVCDLKCASHAGASAIMLVDSKQGFTKGDIREPDVVRKVESAAYLQARFGMAKRFVPFALTPRKLAQPVEGERDLHTIVQLLIEGEGLGKEV